MKRVVLQVSNKDEDFLDLSVDVENNTSITHCLRGFSSTETLRSEHKYYCEVCCSKQEAQKRWVLRLDADLSLKFGVVFSSYFLIRMRIKKLPQILALHLKRFKYVEQLQRFTKLSYRVVFPFELRLFNTVSTSLCAWWRPCSLSLSAHLCHALFPSLTMPITQRGCTTW